MLFRHMRKFIQFFYRLFVKYRVGQVGDSLFVGGFTLVNKTVVLKDNVSFNGMKILGRGGVNIGNNFHSGRECMMITENHNYQGEAIPYDTEIIYKPICIEDNVWLGNRVLILGGVTIGEGAIIQAGSVVVKDIPPLAIAGGNPAKVFKYRDQEHYFKMKDEGRFH
ncbi:acyltransferase [Photobacterium galatheae]|uniref:acyltransferase n=1 Tax=Photobacterium galatheae TaxID=1654360 RepID=UPI00202CF9F8|nr:acyltransferase [Photobacterium galatheae]MCM0147565.1 acyltransferase [Photobacterium galatheae]